MKPGKLQRYPRSIRNN